MDNTNANASIPQAASTLIVSYRSPNNDGGEHYAVIPFPKNYKEALTAALKLLGKYMTNAQPETVILKYSTKSRDGGWIWVEFDPSNWSLVVRPGAEVGIFKKASQKAVATKAFWRGPVYLVFGATKGSLTTWTKFQPEPRYDSSPSIDRPTSYAEAVESTKNSIRNRPTSWNLPPAMAQANEPGKTLAFYLFSDTLMNWIPFPSSVLTDDAAWKDVVPEPLGVMGVIAT
ncbi:hypothetical protein FB451DRAFT_1237216 [Mycena latifolia]|nr:hypothetical protein FB451DRAFT_1237216 [Mycena latifolia]